MGQFGIELAVKAAVATAIGLAVWGHIAEPTHVTDVRRPIKAGNWYEDKPELLSSQLKTLSTRATEPVATKNVSLISADDQPIKPPVIGIIGPHAAYRYSGLAAIRAYKAAANQGIKRVFIFGPLHFYSLRGAALTTYDKFRTPLGDLRVDTGTTARLASQPLFQRNNRAQRQEHSIEMHLPLIRQMLGDVLIVPIYIGKQTTRDELGKIATTLKNEIHEGDLVVASSDFTHYGEEYHYEPFKENVQEQLNKLSADAYNGIRRRDIDAFYKHKKETKDSICGFLPCVLLMTLLPPDAHSTLLDFYKSQDAMREPSGAISEREKSRCVSYLSIVFSGAQWPPRTVKTETPTKTRTITTKDSN